PLLRRWLRPLHLHPDVMLGEVEVGEVAGAVVELVPLRFILVGDARVVEEDGEPGLAAAAKTVAVVVGLDGSHGQNASSRMSWPFRSGSGMVRRGLRAENRPVAA